jgi:chemotaxis protein MotA
MFVIIGIVIVLGSVIGGYVLAGGHLAVLWQPLEFLIIGGAAIGALLIGNSSKVLSGVIAGYAAIVKGPKYKKSDYLELLTMQYQIFRMARTKGMLALEQHVENPHDSIVFQAFPKFQSDHHALEFMCDYLRLLTLGTDNPHEVENLMEQELDLHHHEAEQVFHAMNTFAESYPGLGIVAAVLGIIHTMGSITEPPEILGQLIGAALVGTFAGIWMCYGFFGPMAGALKEIREDEHVYFTCMKGGAGILPSRICACGDGRIRPQSATFPSTPDLRRSRGCLRRAELRP